MRQALSRLEDFYASPLGEIARRMMARRIEALWPHADGLDVLGLGYPLPLLEPFCAGARRVVAALPAGQGARPWPSGGGCTVTLAEETRLPFMDSVFDRVLIVHALEEADAVRPLLRETWRVMAPEARLIAIAANRNGLWAQVESTPFGHGRSYSRNQLAALLRDNLLEPAHSARALYAGPWTWAPLHGLADGFERAGELILPVFGGVVMVEAVKRVEAHAAPAPVSGALAPVRAAGAHKRLRDEASSGSMGP